MPKINTRLVIASFLVSWLLYFASMAIVEAQVIIGGNDPPIPMLSLAKRDNTLNIHWVASPVPVTTTYAWIFFSDEPTACQPDQHTFNCYWLITTEYWRGNHVYLTECDQRPVPAATDQNYCILSGRYVTIELRRSDGSIAQSQTQVIPYNSYLVLAAN